jgi:8-oxo-dGTP diphosphatase
VKPIRVSAKAVIIRDGKLLVTRNVGITGVFYLLPGGAQEAGEALDEAVRRECREEVGVEVEVGEVLFVRDYIGRNHELAEAHHDVHQLELMFRCRLVGDGDARVGAAPDVNQVAVEWLDLARLDEYDLFPRAMKPLLAAIDEHRGRYLGDVN